ncbi:MAG: hypothetical protein IPO04_22095 [Cytophagaceae bacterium]|nr:hypothetical protein [Cytophagaceae bacterium]
MARSFIFHWKILGKKVDDKQCYRIMVTEKGRNGKWKAPYELPAPINMDCEKAPRILADGKTPGLFIYQKAERGDFDLYKVNYNPMEAGRNPLTWNLSIPKSLTCLFR